MVRWWGGQYRATHALAGLMLYFPAWGRNHGTYRAVAGRHDREVQVEVRGGVLQLGVAGGLPAVHRTLAGALDSEAPVEVHRCAPRCVSAGCVREVRICDSGGFVVSLCVRIWDCVQSRAANAHEGIFKPTASHGGQLRRLTVTAATRSHPRQVGTPRPVLGCLVIATLFATYGNLAVRQTL